MAHRRMNSRPVNPAYQFSIHSPPLSPNPSPNLSPILSPAELPPMPTLPVSYWSYSGPPSPLSSSTSSKSSLDSLPLPLSSISGFRSGKEDDYFRDEDEDVFIGAPGKKIASRNQSWLRRPFTTMLTRRPRPRTTFIFLVCLCALSVYIIFTSSSLSSQLQPVGSTHDIPTHQVSNTESLVVDEETPLRSSTPAKVNKKLFKGARPPLVLSPAEELAALSSFLIALPQNVLPSDIDGSKPIDPQLILDFDVRGGRKARAELQVVREQVWENNPVVVYAKRYAPHTKLLLGTLLNPFNVHPPPAVFFVDERHDADILMDALTRISSNLTPQPLMPSLSSPDEATPSLPLLLIGGQLITIPYEDMIHHKDEHDNAAHGIMIKTTLRNAIHRAGAEIREGKKKKKGH